MPYRFQSHPVGVEGPSFGGSAITPSDSTDLTNPIRAITIGTSAGIIKYDHAITGVTYTTGPLPVGTYSIWAKRVYATGTTATGLTGWE